MKGVSTSAFVADSEIGLVIFRTRRLNRPGPSALKQIPNYTYIVRTSRAEDGIESTTAELKIRVLATQSQLAQQ